MTRAIVIEPGSLNYAHQLSMGGAICRLSTNSSVLAETLSRWLDSGKTTFHHTFCMQILVRGGKGETIPAHFRGRGHLVTASFGDDNLFVFDLARLAVFGTVSEQVAADAMFWDRILLPIAIGVFGASIGVVPIHAACLMRKDIGMLIAGASGAGKSTLSLALAQDGFDYVSDDWTYLTSDSGRLLAHGMGAPVKLLPDAVQHFPALRNHRISVALNEELAYELPVQELRGHVRFRCEPRFFLFLERRSSEGCTLVPFASEEAQQYVENCVERLPPELRSAASARSAVTEQVARLSCWKLTYGGPPAVAVATLSEFFAQQLQGVLA